MAEQGRHLDPLQQALGYHFQDPDLLHRALSHRSYSASHNERLEFLGDAVLDYFISDVLFHKFVAADEGQLSRTRAKLVNQPALAGLARDYQLGNYLQLGTGEQNSGGAERDSILADAFEALIAAIYLDGGLTAAHEVLQRCYAGKLDGERAEIADKDAKTRLQEYLQAHKMPLPIYTVIATTGKKHQQMFQVQCELSVSGQTSQGEGGSRRAAEQAAAQSALQLIGEEV